jgi:hypothetical protein
MTSCYVSRGTTADAHATADGLARPDGLQLAELAS